jgi:hypothetical protein
VQEHLILGGFFAAIVVLFFMRDWRSTLIAAVAIPTSIISTYTLMSLMGFTLNQITMLALTLVVGIVIDDAIVVLENIYRFIEEKGMNPFQAAIEGTREIGLAVLATTFSLVIIFLPGGDDGRHGGTLHVELWLYGRVRDHGVAAGELHAHAHALFPLSQGGTHKKPPRKRPTVPAARPPVPRAADLVDAAPLGDLAGRARGMFSSVPLCS